MIAFIIPEKTEVKVIAKNTEWYSYNFKPFTTTKENMFFLEDVRIDPLGNVACGPQDRSTVGGSWAKAGYYGFESKETGHVLMVHASAVITG